MLNCNVIDKNLIVKFKSRELDHHISIPIREEIDEVISLNYVKNIIFDFENMDFMDQMQEHVHREP